MSSVIKIYQGTGKTFNVRHKYTNLPTATEIKVYIDSCPQVVKTLSGGDISNVTSTAMEMAIADADFQSIESGEYRIQAKITQAVGPSLFARFSPSTVRVIDTVFTPVE